MSEKYFCLCGSSLLTCLTCKKRRCAREDYFDFEVQSLHDPCGPCQLLASYVRPVYSWNGKKFTEKKEVPQPVYRRNLLSTAKPVILYA